MSRTNAMSRVVYLASSALLLFGCVVWGRQLSKREFREVVTSTRLIVFQDPEELAKPHLRKAEERIAKLQKGEFPIIAELFGNGRSHVRSFATECLSWSSKWRLAADAVPFTSGDRHAVFIREKFEEQIFTPAQLEQAVKQTIQAYLNEVRSIESKMLVELKADLADFPEFQSLSTLGKEELEAKFDEAITQAIAAIGNDLQSDISSQLVSLIAGEVLAQVAVRLGVSAGILGTGAATGWATFGVGVVVGLIVDQIVSWVWESWADPKQELTKTLMAKLDSLEQLICFGDEHVQGLEQQFKQLASNRAATRRAAIIEMLRASKDQ